MTVRAVVGMAVAQRPGAAGHARLAVDWMTGLRRIGLEPLLVDRLDGTMVGSTGDLERAVRWMSRVMTDAGFADAWSLQLPDGTTAGRSAIDVRHHLRDAFVLDVMGYLGDRAEGAAARAFLDIDPGFRQAWTALGWCKPPLGYDTYLTVGLAMDDPSSSVPDDGIAWRPLPPPVDLEKWPVAAGPGRRIGSIATWRGPYDAIDLDGRRLGLRAHAMRPLASLPHLCRERWPRTAQLPFELVLDIDAGDAPDAALLRRSGWTLFAPRAVSTPASYHDHISTTTAEICVAKELYTRLGTGWFSDRSVCYLAAGRPVIMSDTGVGAALPLGSGLLAFGDLDGAAAAIEDVLTRSEHHRAAARAIAEDHFDAATVAARACDLTIGANT